MRKFLFGLLTAAAIVSPAYAETATFFEVDNVKGWNVTGLRNSEKVNSGSCMATRTWNDGSWFSFVFPVFKGAYAPYVMLSNKSWNITGAPGDYQEAVKIEFNSNKYRTSTGIVTATIMDAQTISLDYLTGEFFVDMGKYDELVLTLTLPGLNAKNSENFIPLEGSVASLMKVMDCVDEGRKMFGEE